MEPGAERQVIHLDTHVVVWLYAGLHLKRIPVTLIDRLETEPLAVSPAVRLELRLLHETGRITDLPAQVLGELERSIGLRTDTSTFSDVVSAGEALTFTRDPFDRLIGAQAIVAGAQLATADRGMRRNLPIAVWD